MFEPHPDLAREDAYVPADWTLTVTRPRDVPPDTGDAKSEMKRRPGVGGFLGRRINRSPAHLSDAHRRIARDRTCEAMRLMLDHADATHYTQTLARWQGIERHLVAAKGEFPTEADCSSTAAWAIWNGIAVPYHVHDVMNHEGWRAGWTGTMIEHGIHAGKPRQWMRGDCLIYGSGTEPGQTEHTAVCVGWDPRTKYHMVISNGSEGAPYYVRWDYRPDLVAVRRYF